MGDGNCKYSDFPYSASVAIEVASSTYLALNLGTALFRNSKIWGFPKIRGTLFEGPHNKNYSISGSILGFPYLGKLPYPLILTPKPLPGQM